MPGAPLKPMLAMTGQLPVGPDWAYEFKWDGVRALADIADGRQRLYARSGVEITTAYPELIPLGEQVGDALLDGEVVLFDPAGRPSFTALAERMHVRNAAKAARLAATVPVTYMIFDVLRLAGQDLTGWPYARRRETLDGLALGAARWAVPPVFADGPATYEAAGEHGLEGVMAKRVESAYRPGVRSPDWVKVKLEVTGDFVVGGWRPGARKIGGLLVGVPGADGRLVYRGRVGGGIGAALERDLLRELEPLRATASPFSGDVPREDARGAIWVTPRLVVEVKYGQRTPDGRLRFPRILRIRPDKPAEEVDDVS
ncbi:non-homologous end-joining DNA ligase [Micromonospora sp. C95]|uniref:non-homologous end-joining DNA ligase n=1 Tax=Micromonospora sp. C95 TaxID=2824882 RepID=UPI001B388FE0|nr:non-homologous end-joining DNA ligase [Micromonospora sp. C95]MBQ1027778.1 non-homologous end-joining DNA ligase [Micromonospora sp. C95]